MFLFIILLILLTITTINNFHMIPLSNGRSPRIDQFYATLRTYKSHHFHQDSHEQSEQDKSIQFIRSVGKQILENISTHKKKSNKTDNSKGLLNSSQLLSKPKNNLYDKYKSQVDKKVVKKINNTKQTIIKQQIAKTPQKLNKNNKYDQVPSKIQQKASLKGLNYVKRADVQYQKLKSNKIETQKIQKQIKQKQNYYERNTKIYKNTKKDLLVSGVLKRTQQITARKVKCIQKLRTEQLQKQMKGVTFEPQFISKRLSTTQHSFQKRNSLAKIKKISNQKQIIKQVMQNHTFYPQTNRYKNSESKVMRIWRQEKEGEHRKHTILNNLKGQYFEGEDEFKEQQTANSTTKINLKSLNQISFIFQ